MADESGTPRYSRDEVEEILRRAAERTHDGGDDLTHDELVSAAREAGIDVGAIEVAATELALRREDQRAVGAWDARRKRRFGSHLITFLIVIAGFGLLDLFFGWVGWSLVIALLWGMGLALHAVSSLRAPTPDQVERVSRKERRRREAERKRQLRRAAAEEMREKFRQAKARRGGAERQFEAAVETGVTALMEVVARKIEQAARGPERPLPDSEFNRYVTQQKGGAQRKGPAPAPVVKGAPPREIITPAPRVRVEDADREALDDELDDERARRRRRDATVSRVIRERPAISLSCRRGRRRPLPRPAKPAGSPSRPKRSDPLRRHRRKGSPL